MHIVQGKRLTGETCIIESIITVTLDQIQHSQHRYRLMSKQLLNLQANNISGTITSGSGRQALR